MALKLKINKGDTVEVIAGGDKGKKGVVMFVKNTPDKPLKIKIQGVKMMTHFDKEKGRHEAEGLIAYSNVKLVEKATKKAAPKKSKSK